MGPILRLPYFSKITGCNGLIKDIREKKKKTFFFLGTKSNSLPDLRKS